MAIAAFDAKCFRRGRTVAGQDGAGGYKKDVGFNTQLGAGVVVDRTDEFAARYGTASRDLLGSFGDDGGIPFPSSEYLKRRLGMSKAISFADQLVSEIAGLVESIHCSYVILPPSKFPSVGVGGHGMPATSIPTRRFIDNLGPMFSYLTAHSYLWVRGHHPLRTGRKNEHTVADSCL